MSERHVSNEENRPWEIFIPGVRFILGKCHVGFRTTLLWTCCILSKRFVKIYRAHWDGLTCPGMTFCVLTYVRGKKLRALLKELEYEERFRVWLVGVWWEMKGHCEFWKKVPKWARRQSERIYGYNVATSWSYMDLLCLKECIPRSYGENEGRVHGGRVYRMRRHYWHIES